MNTTTGSLENSRREQEEERKGYFYFFVIKRSKVEWAFIREATIKTLETVIDYYDYPFLHFSSGTELVINGVDDYCEDWLRIRGLLLYCLRIKDEHENRNVFT